jgi:two-component system, sensor histidine kinase and response regulator
MTMNVTAAQREIASKSIILIVDDVPGNLEILGSLLSEAGFRISVATNGARAISVATTKPPDLILMDVSMPEMDGYEACRRLKAIPATAEIPIIFLTAHSGEDEIVRGFEAGGLDYVTKPFKAPELLARILTHIELKQSRERIMGQNQELQEMNEMLARREEDLRILNSMKDRFFSILAHDLRNPVSNFCQITDLLLGGGNTLGQEDRTAFLRDMHKAASNLRDLLDNILTWARSQTGRIDYRPTLQHIAPIALEAASLLSSGALQKNITIRIEIAETMKAFFDENMIGTVFRNLISNALKFTPTGGEIMISAADQGDFAVISIADTGIGIASSDIEKLFRIDVSHTTIGTGLEKGTGLGLIICKEFLERHGGRIGAASEPTKGSTFTFTLPAHPGT